MGATMIDKEINVTAGAVIAKCRVGVRMSATQKGTKLSRPKESAGHSHHQLRWGRGPAAGSR
jgi:hypothetical protein